MVYLLVSSLKHIKYWLMVYLWSHIWNSFIVDLVLQIEKHAILSWLFLHLMLWDKIREKGTYKLALDLSGGKKGTLGLAVR